MLKQYTLKAEKTDFEKVLITSSKSAAEYIRQFYLGDIEIYESFFILLLNRANKTIGYAKISQGGITGTVVDKKIIAKYVIDSLASGVIIAHNHPSGQLVPSDADKRITKDIKEVCYLIDTQLLDHVILTSEGYLSFSDEGIL